MAFLSLLLALLVPSSSVAAPVASDFYPVERVQFTKARIALAGQDLQTFNRLSSELKDYPLYRYLVYEKLRLEFADKPGKSSVQQLNQFEQDFEDDALTRNLTELLQKSLIDAEKWALFLGVSKSRAASEMLCETARAREETGALVTFDEDMIRLWVNPAPRPALCADVLEKLESRARPGVVALWDRIYAAIDANRAEEVKPLLPQLASADRKTVHLWLKAMDSPDRLLNSDLIAPDNVLNRHIILDLVYRWSAVDPEAAVEHWQKIRGKYLFYRDDRYELSRKLALRGAYRRLPQAQAWLNNFTVRDDDLEIMEWRIRAALLVSDWTDVLARIKDLPRVEREEDHWAYWEARALETTGDTASAKKIYTELAQLQSYHGFLSADQLGQDYNLYEEAITVDPAIVNSLAIRPDLIRAREFHHTGVSWEGRREWGQALSSLSPDEIRASAVLADAWQMPDRAIISAGLAEVRRALPYRFPILFEEEVIGAARLTGIEPAVIYGVIRRESGFVPDIQSGAGAVGLMQLMPATAKMVARLKGQKNWNGNLTDAGVNIDFGTFYLRHVLNRFDNHLLLALASYNAGPNRVDKWLPQEQSMPGDLWVDTIPYSETRRYVRAVLAYSLIFEWRLTGSTTRLSERMNAVNVPAATVEKDL